MALSDSQRLRLKTEGKLDKTNKLGQEPLVASLLLVAMPGAPSSFLLLVVGPGAPSSNLATVCHETGHTALLSCQSFSRNLQSH